MSKSLAVTEFDQMHQMATNVARSGLWKDFNSPEKVLGLMLLCQSEGIHPMEAVRQYDLINGKPALKSEAQLAKFYARGGTVKWVQRDAEACEGIFFSKACPEGVAVKWTIEEARKANLTRNPTWTTYPRQMLSARVQAEGVQVADPASSLGLHNTEELQDIQAESMALASQASQELIGNQNEQLEQAEIIREAKDWKKLRASLNKLLQPITEIKEFRKACSDFQIENGGAQIWIERTGHNDFETFKDLAEVHQGRINDRGPDARTEWAKKVSLVQSIQDLEGFVNAYESQEWLKVAFCEDTLADKAKELGLEHYTDASRVGQ